MGIVGKFDFQDECEMISSPEEILQKYEIFIWRNDLIPLKMTSKKDLVAYYTYPIAIQGWSDGVGKIVLGSQSYIDQWEQEHLDFLLSDLLKYYRKCKREKVEFDKEEALKKIMPWSGSLQPYHHELVKRVSEDGAKATTEGLHHELYDRMRKEWYELMIDSGWDEKQAYRWVYGWRRYLQRENLEEYGNGYVQQRLNLNDSDN